MTIYINKKIISNYEDHIMELSDTPNKLKFLFNSIHNNIAVVE